MASAANNEEVPPEPNLAETDADQTSTVDTAATATNSIGDGEQDDPFLSPADEGRTGWAGHHRRERHHSRQDSCASIIDGLLFEIYDRWHAPHRDGFDSDTWTDISSTSDAFFGRHDSIHLELEQKHSNRLKKSFLANQDVAELRQLRGAMQHRVTQSSARLIRQLKRRNRAKAQINKSCEVITAVLQAASLKRWVDSKIRFSLEPMPGESAFQQWKDGMRAVARLPMGIPPEFRKKVWLALADVYIRSLKLDWEKTKKFAFNERSNPDDNTLGMQIVKDLHRTGCSGFSGDDNDEERALLKRVLLAYARWNKRVGYCQGFNVLAALILDVMGRKEDDALKVMIFLVDNVLPESYFANNLRALSVDMAVFRDLLKAHLPKLSAHLDQLQSAARDDTTGANYEPPLTNVFTMQWFLTLFATCLPMSTALRVWDSVLLEGSEILLRAALAIWGRLSSRILAVQSADEFYTTMGVLTQEMLDESIINPDDLIKKVYSLGPVPYQQIADLREKYTYNITPFSATMATGRRPNGRGMQAILSDEDDMDDDELMDNITCFTGIFPPGLPGSPSKTRALGDVDRSQSGSSFDISKASPGAYGASPESVQLGASAYSERMTLDVHMLRNQYKRLRERQKQAHIILAAASARHQAKSHGGSSSRRGGHHVVIKPKAIAIAPIESPVAVNHLFIGRTQGVQLSKGKNRTVVDGPNIAPLYQRKGSHLSASRTSVASTLSVDRSSTSTLEPDDEVFSDSNTSPRLSATPDSSPNMSPFHLSGSSTPGSPAHASGDGDRPLDADLITLEMVERRTGRGTAEDRDAASPNGGADTSAPERGESVDSNCNSIGVKESASDQKPSDTRHSPSRKTDAIPSDSRGENPIAERLYPDLKKQREATRAEVATSKAPMKNGIHKPTLLEVASGLPAGHAGGVAAGQSSQPPSSPGDVVTDKNAQYVAKLTYKSHKVAQAQQEVGAHGAGSGATSPLGRRPPPKVFNPFPSQHVTNRRIQNGIKLGLYSAKNLPKFETGIIRAPEISNISRSQHNACIHRQYMAEVKGQSKSAKS